MPGYEDDQQRGTGRPGLPNWSALRHFAVRVGQLISLPEHIAFAVGHATTKPTCDSSRRDGEMNTRGATGVADWKYICQKNTSDTYAWNRTLGYRVAAAIANIDQHSADATGAILALRKSRHATEGSHTIVQSGDGIGAIAFYGSNGTSFDAIAFITAFSDGTPGASNDMPGRLVFSVTPDGSATPGEAMRISQDKTVTLEGPLDHDGTTAGFYGATPVVQAADFGAVDASTVDATYGTQERDVITSLRTNVDAIRTALRNLGLVA